MTRVHLPAREIEARAELVRKELLEYLDQGGSLAVVQAPPGSGKTHLLLEVVAHAVRQGLRVAVATQTNAQADDICKRLDRDHPKTLAIRFTGLGYAPQDFPEGVLVASDKHELPLRRCVVVGTAAKWGLIDLEDSFDLLIVEEAWQLKWADFMLLDQVSPRFVLIGDPGQIPPVMTIEPARWETSARPPHIAAPEVLLGDRSLGTFRLSLPGTRRLPHDTTGLIRPFYDFDFGSWAGPGDRKIEVPDSGRAGISRALAALREATAVGVTLPTPDGGPPLERDDEIAKVCVDLVRRLLALDAICRIDGTKSRLRADEIGLCATHHAMNAALEAQLPAKLRSDVRVETAERWQGLERPMMIVVHPLSGVVEPSGFDLDTGRLCVMASRHRAGLIVVSRDHLKQTLEEFLPAAEQAPGRPDSVGRGHARNLGFWTDLEGRGLVFSA